MLIKGCKKNLIVVKSIGSDYIEEAYLLLKADLPEGTAKGDIVKEANRLIHEYNTGQKKRRRPFSLPSFLIGVFLASAVSLLLLLLL